VSSNTWFRPVRPQSTMKINPFARQFWPRGRQPFEKRYFGDTLWLALLVVLRFTLPLAQDEIRCLLGLCRCLYDKLRIVFKALEP
jgi:hypothetical protein